jgi:hypothetical protein
MADHVIEIVPVQILRTVQALIPDHPAEAVFVAAIARQKRQELSRAGDPPSPQDGLERMVIGIAEGDKQSLSELTAYMKELGLAEQLVGHLMYLIFLTLPENTLAKLSCNEAGQIQFQRQKP